MSLDPTRSRLNEFNGLATLMNMEDFQLMCSSTEIEVGDSRTGTSTETKSISAIDSQLVFVKRAKQELLAAKSIDDVCEIRDKAEAIRVYCKTSRISLQAQNAAAEVKVRAERRAGELLREMKFQQGARGIGKKVESHDATPLSDLGINKSQSSRWQQLSKISDDSFEGYIQGCREHGEEITTAALSRLARCLSVQTNSGEFEWYTPRTFVESARRVMGSIDLDPASTETAQSTVGAKQYFTQETDGLTQDWYGNVWLNPPYASRLIQRFVEKLCEELDSNRVQQAIVLTNSGTDTGWFCKLASKCSMLCFTKGRIAFVNRQGNAVAGAAQGQVFFYFGARHKAFSECFDSIGTLMCVL